MLSRDTVAAEGIFSLYSSGSAESVAAPFRARRLIAPLILHHGTPGRSITPLRIVDEVLQTVLSRS